MPRKFSGIWDFIIFGASRAVLVNDVAFDADDINVSSLRVDIDVDDMREESLLVSSSVVSSLLTIEVESSGKTR